MTSTASRFSYFAWGLDDNEQWLLCHFLSLEKSPWNPVKQQVFFWILGSLKLDWRIDTNFYDFFDLRNASKVSALQFTKSFGVNDMRKEVHYQSPEGLKR